MKITLDRIEKVENLEQLSKLVDFNTVKTAVRAYLKNRAYHHMRNQKISQLLRENRIAEQK